MPTVKVLQSVSHGKYHLHEGETRDDIDQGNVNTLKELGFVVEVLVEAPEDLSDEDLVGTKAAPELDNKMAAPVEDKAAKTAKK